MPVRLQRYVSSNKWIEALKNNKLVTTLVVSLIIIIILGLGCSWLYNVFIKPAPYYDNGEIEIVIEKGINFHQVANTLENNSLISNQNDFRWAAFFLRAERKIQPGRFILPRGASNYQILKCLLKPGILTVNITVPEGLTVKQIASLFQNELNIDSIEFVNLCDDSSFVYKLGIESDGLEGYLFPETYNFYLDSKPREIIKRMVSMFNEVFNDSLRTQLKHIGLSIQQAVTLASIIQGEVIIAKEAPLVSAVYHNRLKRGMLLGADPTIQYIIPDGPRRLLNRDLKINSPYNTYRFRGLPPGPVNNPGRIALEAAVRPVDVNYLYFVAKGDGSHAFNYTHSGHSRDKAKFQQVRRKVERQKRYSNK
ncbi:MAG: endolytic transglycosylase MltG [Candidatus Hatepunaea meridiana]|nr:endolytic transglycosylase MltG [Candidatus Hatepunaea meridiana]